MGTPSMEEFLTGRSNPPKLPKQVKQHTESMFPSWLILALFGVLAAAVGYLFYDNNRFQQQTSADIAQINTHIKQLADFQKAGVAEISNIKGELTDTKQAVGTTKAEIKRTAQQLQTEGQKTKAELSQAISSKADTAQVQAIKNDADTKIGQVSTEVGGVKTEVGTVKTDLASTKRDLEGTQRQLVDVRDNLTAAVAKNSSELGELRRKGERDYIEFEIPKKNQYTKVEDIRLVLTKTDPKKGKYSLQVLVDDNKLDKKDRTINEPLQFLVGHNRVRYEVVINWVQKDKALSAERAGTPTK